MDDLTRALTALDWERLSVVAVLSIGVWAFMTGRIVPKSTHDRALTDRDKQTELAERAIDISEALTRAGHGRRP